MAEDELANAVRLAIESHPEGAEAGPKVIHTSLQASDERFAAVSLMKFKKIFSKVKTTIKEGEEQAKLEAGKPKAGTAEDCPGKHGLRRALTNHSSYCCDVCRSYCPQGAFMWSCRICGWDVCEGRCHGAWTSLEDLKEKLAGLVSQVEELKKADATDLKTRLALVETDVHKFERCLDNTPVHELCQASILQLEEDEARVEKKAVIKDTEALLQTIEILFSSLRVDT